VLELIQQPRRIQFPAVQQTPICHISVESFEIFERIELKLSVYRKKGSDITHFKGPWSLYNPSNLRYKVPGCELTGLGRDCS
jgi:hypothetical protein